ncbi:hypothetical protein PROFUN_13003 [Planoprotostelium fungivorum]|uniref:Yippee domain-containing protein n=1 Tax=Planoprotostelium fungivorum TaxID=1890364 RepID=A0A2P6N5T0_9EUKA|nr:hypothetical protein PROFUN_13003 [Planoprotostelium fungivorum]
MVTLGLSSVDILATPKTRVSEKYSHYNDRIVERRVLVHMKFVRRKSILCDAELAQVEKPMGRTLADHLRNASSQNCDRKVNHPFMGRRFVLSVPGENVWCCKICTTPLIDNNLMLSDKYTASTGEAYLFTEAANVSHGKQRAEKLRSGVYLICDLHFVYCHQRLGWHYVSQTRTRETPTIIQEESASDEQKYKEGKCVLEKQQITLLRGHHSKV